MLTNANTRLLLNLILSGDGGAASGLYLTDNPETECAYYPESRTLVVINNADTPQECGVQTGQGTRRVRLEAYGTWIREI